MEYTFSWNWFFIGTLILIAGAALTIWYRPIADNVGGGVGSYDRYRLWGLVGIGIGLITMLNLHTLLLYAFFSNIFSR